MQMGATHRLDVDGGVWLRCGAGLQSSLAFGSNRWCADLVLIAMPKENAVLSLGANEFSPLAQRVFAVVAIALPLPATKIYAQLEQVLENQSRQHGALASSDLQVDTDGICTHCV